jgi:hypothetical protein
MVGPRRPYPIMIFVLAGTTHPRRTSRLAPRPTDPFVDARSDRNRKPTSPAPAAAPPGTPTPEPLRRDFAPTAIEVRSGGPLIGLVRGLG